METFSSGYRNTQESAAAAARHPYPEQEPRAEFRPEIPQLPIYGENLLSLSVWWVTTIPALIVTGLLVWPLYNFVWSGFGTLWFVAPLFVVLWLPMLLAVCATPRYCPACWKRVKLGATRCHHCTQRFDWDYWGEPQS